MDMILSKWIIIPLVMLLGGVVLASYVWGMSEYSYLLVPLVIAVAAVYVSHEYIDRWYVRKYPQKLPKGMMRFIEDHMPLARLMEKDQKQSFENATSMFLKSKTFMPQGFDKVPEDLKVVVAANAHILAAFRPEWHKLFDPYENIVIYKHPFPSPQHPKYLHSSELYVQDKVLLFCADHFMKAHRFPQDFFNTAMYEWVKIIFMSHPPEFKLDLEVLPEISGFENEQIVDYIGLPEAYIQWEAVATTYFFAFPVRYKMHLDESYEKISEYFGVDPMSIIGSSTANA